MLKKFMGSAVVAATALALASTGAAADKAKIKQYSYDVQSAWTTLYVTSSDGAKWDTIKDGTLKFFAHMKIDTKWPGEVTDVGIVLGKCEPEVCRFVPILWSKPVFARDFLDQTYVSVPTSLLSGTTLELSSERQKIIDTCNQNLSAFGATKRHEFQHSLSTTFIADTDKAWGRIVEEAGHDTLSHPGDINHAKNGDFTFNVVCKPYAPPPDSDDLQKQRPTRAGNTLYSVDLKVSQHGDRCPKDITVTAYANYKGPAESRMRMQVNGGFPKARVVKTKKVTFAGKSFHRAQAQFKYKLDPGQKTFNLTVDGKKGKTQTKTVEIKCPPFKVTSAWLKYEVEDTPVCPKKVTETATFHTTRPGWVNHEIKMQGGLVVSSGKLTAKRDGDKYVATAVRHLTMNAIDKEFMADAVDYPANSGWMGLKVDCLELAGDLSYVDVGSPKCSRRGEALVSFKSNMPVDVQYKIDCTNGQSFSGVAKSVKLLQGGYVAAAMKTFDIDKTTVYSCALKSVQPGPVKLHNWKGHTFDCVHRAVETGPSDVQVVPKPSDDGPRTPAADVKVAPKPTGADTGKRRREALKKARERARKKAEAEKRRKAAEKAAEARRKREAAKKAAELRRKRAAEKKKAAELRRKRRTAKKAAALKRKTAKRRQLVK